MERCRPRDGASERKNALSGVARAYSTAHAQTNYPPKAGVNRPLDDESMPALAVRAAWVDSPRMAVLKATMSDVREYAPGDEEAVLDLLAAAFGRWPSGLEDVEPREFFRWKTELCPFGASRSWVVETGGELVAFVAQLPWRMHAGDRTLTTLRGTDLAVHPDHHGRGIAQQLLRGVLAAQREDVALTWNNPTAPSRKSQLKVGRRKVVAVPRFARPGAAPVQTFGRILTRGPSLVDAPKVTAPPAVEVLSDDAFLARVIERLPLERTRLTTLRTPEYLRWRYSFESYRAVRTDGADEDGSGIAIFRLRRSEARGRTVWLADVCELLAPRPRVARELLRAVARASAADFACATFTSHSHALRHAVPLRAGAIELLARPVHADLPVDPTRSSGWALSLGDLELL